jgi:predicted XRE-type DNA-binding protein
MDWTNIISVIRQSGLTQTAIAEDVGLTQPSLSDLANGKTAEPKWSTGDALLRIYDRVMKAKKREEARKQRRST